jgi:DNA (cytosine-5)-methyltransferase 1
MEYSQEDLDDWGGQPVFTAIQAVLGSLADIGYDAKWCGLRAADAGAPHNRFRVFIIAYPSNTKHDGA